VTAFEATRECARSLDRDDSLSAFRKRFRIPAGRDGSDCIYVCGNSLGLMPDAANDYVDEVMTEWARLGVEGHFKGRHPWLSYHRLATAGFAELAGAERSEVVAMNSLTVNLHLLMAGFYRPDGTRTKIVVESTAFPSDYYAVESQIRLHGLDPAECLLEWRPRDDERLYEADLAALLDQHASQIALLLLPGVQYLTGQVLDMRAIVEMAHRQDIVVGLDLAHAIGNVILELHDWGVDFAAWCTYKYLNAGPGAIAGAFVHARHHDSEVYRPLTGWWGHDEATRFLMNHEFDPATGAERWQLSNPPILSLAPVVASLDVFREAGLERLRDKSIRQTAYLDYLLTGSLAGQVASITPPEARGCQLSLIIVNDGIDARGVFNSLQDNSVIADWREPNVIRVAPVPLYNSFEDIYELSRWLTEAVRDNEQI
jgi:kynureninase